jgi:hypothetical protein
MGCTASVLVAAGLLLATGCGGGEPSAEPTTVAPAAPTTTATTLPTTTTRADGKPANPLLDDVNAILEVPGGMSPTIRAAAEGYARAEQAFIRALEEPITVPAPEVTATAVEQEFIRRQSTILKTSSEGSAETPPTQFRIVVAEKNTKIKSEVEVQVAACYTADTGSYLVSQGHPAPGRLTSTRVYALMKKIDGTWKIADFGHLDGGNWDGAACRDE